MFTLIGTALCRTRHSAVYAEPRTMPNALMADLESGLFSGRAVVVGPETFGIVWLVTTRSRIPSDDRWVEIWLLVL
ncbi:MAG: hypothetical protein OEU92_28520, partial [Alphaproteobacteria bacterium]|nr:hypothetical protein [Alphaproteobacteria bacterium]